MTYQSKPVEIITTRTTFGTSVSQIKILTTGQVLDVPTEELKEDSYSISLHELEFRAMAAKIKNEMNGLSMLAPFESNIVPLPHQILALEKVMNGSFLRFLMADEVGMGKTIEAGLILKELKLRGIVKRCLVIVPVSAMRQWQTELKKHFNETFHVYDSDFIGALSKTFSKMDADNEINIWKQHNQLIVSTDALKPLEARQGWTKEKIDEYNRYRIQGVIDADFDLIIIDECHKVGGSTTTVSRYQMAEILCNAIPNVLLLSATPHRGKSDHFRRILGLLDSDAFTGDGMPSIAELEPYVVRTEKRQAIDYTGKPLFNKRRTERVVALYDSIRHSKQNSLYEEVTNYIIHGFNLAQQTKNTSYGFVMVLFQRLMSSSTQAILDAIQKRVERLSAEKDEINKAIASQQLLISGFGNQIEFDFDDKVITTLTNSKAAYDTELEELKKILQNAKNCVENERDAKFEYLLERLHLLKLEENNQDLKFLIFTEFTSTQKMLQNELTNRAGFSCEIINGSMDFETRVEALKRFKESAQILVSTDAAGESLNMQFAHIIINYDMPWNPMVIEQRIGRVDRIGQTHEVLALNLMLDNSIDQRVYEVIETKLDQIMNELGIDKTADVLDSTLETDSINKLYLTSLLDPSRFTGESDAWLQEIREKLRNFKSTESALPAMSSTDITIKRSDTVRYSPLPAWLECMTKSWLKSKQILYTSVPVGIQTAFPGESNKVFTFDTKEGLENPIPEILTVQSQKIKDIFSDATPYTEGNPIPVFTTNSKTVVTGCFMLWTIKAYNSYETKEKVIPLFISQDEDIFPAYAQDFWKDLSLGNLQGLMTLDTHDARSYFSKMQKLSEVQLERYYTEMEKEIKVKIEQVKINREKAFAFQIKQVEKIGIEQIKNYRKDKYQKDFSIWKETFESSSRIIPELTCNILLRVEHE